MGGRQASPFSGGQLLEEGAPAADGEARLPLGRQPIDAWQRPSTQNWFLLQQVPLPQQVSLDLQVLLPQQVSFCFAQNGEAAVLQHC